MPMTPRLANDPGLLEAALEGLYLQKQRIEAQIAEVKALLGRRRSAPQPVAVVDGVNGVEPRKRQLSEAARKRIAAAQKRRWAEYRKTAKQATP